MNPVDTYIAAFPNEVQQRMNDLRKLIKAAAPQAEESISYAMPAYKLHGKPLVYFAGFPHHIGFYATPSAQKEFSNALADYKQGKGSVQFPLDRALPLPLIRKMVAFKVKEITDGAVKKKEAVFSSLAAPARRALDQHGISTLKKLSQLTEREVLGWHGMGQNAMVKLRLLLKENGLTFKA